MFEATLRCEASLKAPTYMCSQRVRDKHTSTSAPKVCLSCMMEFPLADALPIKGVCLTEAACSSRRLESPKVVMLDRPRTIPDVNSC